MPSVPMVWPSLMTGGCDTNGLPPAASMAAGKKKERKKMGVEKKAKMQGRLLKSLNFFKNIEKEKKRKKRELKRRRRCKDDFFDSFFVKNIETCSLIGELAELLVAHDVLKRERSEEKNKGMDQTSQLWDTKCFSCG